jgi:2',3'-cyclic-nucleotide 2'-phosphodiesterase (5'-nucleotidase family)
MGSGSSTPPLYKRIVLSSTAGATNIANTGYGLEKGAPYSTSLPTATLPSGISAMPRMDLIDLLDTNQLSKFGFVVTTNIEPSAIPEKFEGLTLVPLQDPAFPNDYLLLVGSDNDFFAPVVYHNGQPLVTNTLFMDTVVFAYRVTLPNVGRVAPENLLPGVVFTGPTNATFSAPADFTLATTAYDQDGIVTKVEFYEGETKLGEDTSFPFLLPLTGVPAAVHAYIAVATDHLGAVSTSALKTVTVTVENLLPAVALVGPTNASLSAPARVVLNATAGDADGTVTRLQVFDGSTLVGDTANSTLTLTLNGVLAGIHTYTAYAIDNQNATNASIPVVVNVTAENLLPAVEVTAPADGATYIAPANFTLTAAVGDADGFVTNVTFYRNGTRLGAATASPWNLAVSNQPLGALSFTAVAFDNQGSNTTSAAVAVTVLKNVNTQPLTLQILHASDLEAGVNAVFDAPAFSSVLGALKAQMPANTLILSSGDNYIPGPFFNAAGDAAAGFNGVAGRADIAMLNAMGFQAAAFGNHEFDAGPPQVRSLILRDTAVGYQGTMFPYLSANLDFSTDSSMASLVTTDGKLAHTASNQIAKSCVLSVVGQQIGIVGATTKELRSISSPGNVGVNTNIAAAVQSAVDALLAQGLNKIIVLAHLQQYANEIELAQQLRDVDVVIAGGSHAIFAKPTDHLRAGDVAATNYPVWLNTALGEPVAVVNAGANYEYVGRLILNFGTNGLIVAYDPASGVYATDEEGVFLTGNYPTNATVLNIASTIGGIINAKDGNLFGRTTVYLNGLRQYGRTEEINLGNLTADANLWRGQQVDSTASISLKNGGGIRDSIGAVLGYGGGAAYVPPLANPSVGKQFGDISQLDIENALRFNNGLALITLTAQQLRDTMEWGVAAVAPGATPGQFPQIGGMWFSYNPTNPAMTYTRSNTVVTGIATPGSRLQSLVARRGDGSLDLVVENGVLVGDPNRTFRMVTLGFLADGGDTYYPLTQASNRVNLAPTSGNTFTTDGGEQWALAAYLTNIHVYTQADTTADRDQRIQNMAFRTDTVTWPLLTRVVPGAGVTIYFTTLPGKHYEVWSAQTLGGSWINLTPTTPITGTGFLASYTDTTPGSPTFYRLRRID